VVQLCGWFSCEIGCWDGLGNWDRKYVAWEIPWGGSFGETSTERFWGDGIVAMAEVHLSKFSSRRALSWEGNNLVYTGSERDAQDIC